MKSHIAAAVVLLAALVAPAPLQAQEQNPAAASGVYSTLKVQVVISRYQGEKKISSLPYTLMLNIDAGRTPFGSASLRLGTQVPITTMTRQSGDPNAPLAPSVQYKDVGTNIDCKAAALADGRFRLDLTVEDSSVDTAPGNGAAGTHPTFRSFKTNDLMVLRDGQSGQFSTATDKVSGDVWKIDVTVNVVK